MITESALANVNSSAIVEEPTVDPSEAIIPENRDVAADYQEWLDEAADICGDGMKGDIDPTHKQAENIGPVANDLAEQLGLEDLSDAVALIDAEEEAELNKMDEDSRQFDFTAEDVGINQSEGEFTLRMEQAWVNIDSCMYNIQRLEMKEQDATELCMALESHGNIDQDFAAKIKERIPGALNGVPIKSFTRNPSSVGYKLAREGSLAGKILVGTLVVAGVIFLIYKILTWTIEGIKAISRVIKRNREKARNLEKTVDKVGRETFDPETMDVDKVAKGLFIDPGVGIKAQVKSVGRQPLELRNIKWVDTKDFAHLITPLLIKHLDDIEGYDIMAFNDKIENLVDDVHKSIGFAHELLDGILETQGDLLHVDTIREGLQTQLSFVDKYINELKVPINFSHPSNIERLKAVHEHLDNLIKPEIAASVNAAPPLKFIKSLGRLNFDVLTDEFAQQITVIRDTLNPKTKKTIIEDDTPEQADLRKEIIKEIAVTFMTLSNVIRTAYHYTLYIESVIVAEDQFMTKVKKITS